MDSDPKSPIDEMVKEKKSRWIESLEKDLYIEEAVNILEDQHKLEYPTISSNKKIIFDLNRLNVYKTF